MPKDDKSEEDKKPQQPTKDEAPKAPPPDWDNVKSNDPHKWQRR